MKKEEIFMETKELENEIKRIQIRNKRFGLDKI